MVRGDASDGCCTLVMQLIVDEEAHVTLPMQLLYCAGRYTGTF